MSGKTKTTVDGSGDGPTITTVQSIRRFFGIDRIETSIWEKLVFYISLALTIFIILFPVYWMVISSFLPDSELYSTPPTVLPSPDQLTLDHYYSVFSTETFPFLIYFRNSLIVALSVATLSVVVAAIGAYSMTRLRYPGRRVFSRGVLIVYMFSGILLVVPLYQMIVLIGLNDTLYALMITYLVQCLPLSLYMLASYFQSIPQEIEEAAMIDGYSRLEVIYRVTLPLSAPALIAVFMYAFIIAWNEYLFASIFLRTNTMYTLPIGIESLVDQFHDMWGTVMAASLLTSLPVIVLFMYLEKYMVEGLTLGSVEG